MRIMGRLFGYILRRYKLHCLGVLLFIFGSTAATVAGNLFMKTLIDDYIVPYIGEGGASDFGPLLAALLKMGCVFLFGVLCTLLYNRIMVYVSQGDDARHPRRFIPAYGAPAHPLFRHPCPRRYHEHLHQRHRHAAPDDQPEHAPARLFGGNDRQRILLHACPQPAADRVDAGDGVPYAVHHQKSSRAGPAHIS